MKRFEDYTKEIFSSYKGETQGDVVIMMLNDLAKAIEELQEEKN
jgi:hypothetical protein